LSDETFEREVEKRFNIVEGLYGDRLDREQLEEVRNGVETIVKASRALASVKLENSDEPFSVFAPYRGED
jgi:hypothetical protein